MVLPLSLQRALIFPTALVAQRYGPPRAAPDGAALVSLATPDGERLVGLYRAPEAGAGLILTFHGNASSPMPHAERFLDEPWRGRGWGFLAIAYRGYPGSTGRPSAEGLTIDAETALAFARREAAGAPLLLHGHSLGSGVATTLAARHAAIALCLEAPFSSLRAAAEHRVPILPRLFMVDQIASDRLIGRVRAPIEIVHGTADLTIPIALGRKLAEAARPGLVTFTEVPGGNHVSILGARDQAWAALALDEVAPGN